MERFDYETKIQNSRLEDVDGDLSYTIHINKALEICAELENYYLKKLIEQ